MDDANFANLDTVLARVKRRTLEEAADAQSFYTESSVPVKQAQEPVEDEDALMELHVQDWFDSDDEL